MDLAIHYR